MAFFDAIGDVLFGGEGEFRTPPSPEVQQVSKLSPELEKLLNETLLPFLGGEDLAGVMGPEFGGQLAPGAGEIERLSLAALEDQSRSLVSGQTAETLGQAQGALQNVFSMGPQDIDEFFTRTVQDPLLEGFERDILPRIGREFGGTAFFGSERREADTRAREDLLDTLGRERARTAFGARESDLNRIMQGLGLTGAVTGAGGDVAGGILSGGILGRQLEGQLLGSQYQDFLRRTGERDKRTQQIMQALGLGTAENIVSPAIFEQGQEGIAGELLGMGSTIAASFIGA